MGGISAVPSSGNSGSYSSDVVSADDASTDGLALLEQPLPEQPLVLDDEFNLDPYPAAPVRPDPSSSLGRTVADVVVPFALGTVAGIGGGLLCGPPCAVAGGSLGSGGGRALVSLVADGKVDWVDAGVTASITAVTGGLGLGASALTKGITQSVPRLLTTVGLTSAAGNVVSGGATLLMTDGDWDAAAETTFNVTSFGTNMALSLGLHVTLQYGGAYANARWGPQVRLESAKIAEYIKQSPSPDEFQPRGRGVPSGKAQPMTPDQLGAYYAKLGYTVADIERIPAGSNASPHSSNAWPIAREVAYRRAHGLPAPESAEAAAAETKAVADYFRDRPHGMFRSMGGGSPVKDSPTWDFRDGANRLIDGSSSPEAFASMLRGHGIFTVEDVQRAGIPRAPTSGERIANLATLLRRDAELDGSKGASYFPGKPGLTPTEAATEYWRLGLEKPTTEALLARRAALASMPPEVKVAVATERFRDFLAPSILQSLKSINKTITELSPTTSEGVDQLSRKLAEAGYTPREVMGLDFEVMGMVNNAGHFAINVDATLQKVLNALASKVQQGSNVLNIPKGKPN